MTKRVLATVKRVHESDCDKFESEEFQLMLWEDKSIAELREWAKAVSVAKGSVHSASANYGLCGS